MTGQPFSIATEPFPATVRQRQARDPQAHARAVAARNERLAELSRVNAAECPVCGRRKLCCVDERGVATRRPHPERVAAADAARACGCADPAVFGHNVCYDRTSAWGLAEVVHRYCRCAGCACGCHQRGPSDRPGGAAGTHSPAGSALSTPPAFVPSRLAAEAPLSRPDPTIEDVAL